MQRHHDDPYSPPLLFDPDRHTAPSLEAFGPADPEPGAYYVSALDRTRWWLLLGPFEEHADAIAWVPHARAKAHDLDPGRAAFLRFGTARDRDVPPKEALPGLLNAALGLPNERGRLIAAGTRPPLSEYHVGRARFWHDPDDPDMGAMARGWEWEGRRYVLAGTGPLPRGAIALEQGLLLDTCTGDVHRSAPRSGHRAGENLPTAATRARAWRCQGGGRRPPARSREPHLPARAS